MARVEQFARVQVRGGFRSRSLPRGADVAWITDELGDEGRAARVLTVRAWWEQIGAVAEMVGLGALAWATDLGAAIVVAGAAMAALGALVALRFEEHGFEPTHEHRWRESVAIFRRGLALARRDHEILIVFAAIFAISPGAEAFDRLHPRRLVDLGFPDDPDPIVWFTLLGIAGVALALRAVEHRIDGAGAPRRVLVAASAVGVVGLLLLATPPTTTSGSPACCSSRGSPGR